MVKEPEKEDDGEEAADEPPVTPSISMRPSPPRGTPRAESIPASRKPTPLGLGRVRPPAATLTDPAELEAARQRSIGSVPAGRRTTPAAVLSLANARIPSNLPPTKEGDSAIRPHPSWDQLPTTPPPPEQQALVDATAGIDTPRVPDAAPAPPPITEQEMKDRVAVGDFSGALEIAEKLLDEDPNDQGARTCADDCRETLKKMYLGRIGSLARVAVVSVPRDQLRWLSIDHKAGFVLSLVDGVSTLEMVLDLTGMTELDALRILSELVQQRIITLR